MGEEESIYTKDIVLVMLASFCFMISVMFVTPIMNGYAKSLGANSTFAGVIVGAMSIVAIFLRPIAGNLTDKFTKYRLSFISGIFVLIGVIGYVIAPKSNWLLFFRIINGIGYVLGTSCMSTWLALLVPRNRVGEAMGIYGLMNALAMALAPALAINLFPIVGYRKSLLVAAIVSFLMIVLIQFISDHGQPFASPSSTEKKKVKLIQKNDLPVMVLAMLFVLPYCITQADIVTYVAQRHINVAVGAYFLVYAIILLIIRLSLKRYFDLVPFGIWFWISTGSLIIFIFLMSNLQNNWYMILSAAFLAMNYGIIYSVLQATALLLAPIEEQGLASSTFYLGLDIGLALGPIIAGYIDQILPIQWFYPVQIVIVPVIIIVYFIYRKRLNNAIKHISKKI